MNHETVDTSKSTLISTLQLILLNITTQPHLIYILVNCTYTYIACSDTTQLPQNDFRYYLYQTSPISKHLSCCSVWHQFSTFHNSTIFIVSVSIYQMRMAMKEWMETKNNKVMTYRILMIGSETRNTTCGRMVSSTQTTPLLSISHWVKCMKYSTSTISSRVELLVIEYPNNTTTTYEHQFYPSPILKHSVNVLFDINFQHFIFLPSSLVPWHEK